MAGPAGVVLAASHGAVFIIVVLLFRHGIRGTARYLVAGAVAARRRRP